MNDVKGLKQGDRSCFENILMNILLTCMLWRTGLPVIKVRQKI